MILFANGMDISVKNVSKILIIHFTMTKTVKTSMSVATMSKGKKRSRNSSTKPTTESAFVLIAIKNSTTGIFLNKKT